MTPAISNGIIYFCLARDFDKNLSKMAVWNERLILEANSNTMCSSAFLLNKKSVAKVHGRDHRIAAIKRNRARLCVSDPDL